MGDVRHNCGIVVAHTLHDAYSYGNHPSNFYNSYNRVGSYFRGRSYYIVESGGFNYNYSLRYSYSNPSYRY